MYESKGYSWSQKGHFSPFHYGKNLPLLNLLPLVMLFWRFRKKGVFLLQIRDNNGEIGDFSGFILLVNLKPKHIAYDKKINTTGITGICLKLFFTGRYKRNN